VAAEMFKTASAIREVGEILAELSLPGTDLSILKKEPGDVFRKIYDHWVERGGHRRGKP